MKELKIDPKPPKQLFKEVDGKYEPVDVWYCGECRVVAFNEDTARRCCKMPCCTTCSKHFEGPAYYTTCPSCAKEVREAMEKARWEKMPVVEYKDSYALYDGDEYYYDVDAYENNKDYIEQDYDEFLEVCNRVPLGELMSADDVLDHIHVRLGEELEDEIELVGEEVFYKQIEEFLKKQTQYYVYHETGKKIKVRSKDGDGKEGGGVKMGMEKKEEE